MSFLLHVSVKVTNVDISSNSFSGDNYAVLWLHNADWDKYQTSRPVMNSPPIELFLHNVTDLVVEIKDTRPLLKDKSYGKVTIELFDSHGKLRYPELTETTVNEKLKGKVRTKGKIELVLLLHMVYSSPNHKIDRSQIHYPFRNLVLEGGGVRGVAYGGCLEILESKGILANLVRICGTSAGAIAALLLSLGASAGRIKLALDNLDFASFKDGNLISNFGLSLHSGKALSATIKQLIEAMLSEARVNVEMLNQFGLPPIQSLSDTTFAHLSVLHQRNPSLFRQFYAIGTKLSPNLKNPEQVFEMVVFSAEKYPQFPLWKATRISMGLPFYFKPITIDGIPHVDGGVLYNYAINVFDNGDVANPETLGIRVDKPAEIAKFIDQKLECHSQGKLFRQKYGNIPSFDEVSDWITSNIQNSLSIYQTTKTDDGRSVYINTGSIGTTDFDIKKEHRDGLMQYGRAWCNSFFSWWDEAYLKNPTPTGPLEEAGKLKTMRQNPDPNNMNMNNDNNMYANPNPNMQNPNNMTNMNNNMYANPNPNMQNPYPMNPDPKFCPNQPCPHGNPNCQPMYAGGYPNMAPNPYPQGNPNVCPQQYHA